MSRQLLLLRHGKSDWGAASSSDFDRPLKQRGIKAAQRMGLWLQQQKLIPDYIRSSPATRAKNTAEITSKAMCIDEQQIYYDASLYAASLQHLKNALASCPPSAQRVMLIGHNPGLESLLEFLNKGSLPISNDGKLLATATLAIFAMPDNWNTLSTGCAKLLSITRPADLPDSIAFNVLTDTKSLSAPTQE